jgi:hypothetical protein
MQTVGFCWGTSVSRTGPWQDWQLDQWYLVWGAGAMWKNWTTISGSSMGVCTSLEPIETDV